MPLTGSALNDDFLKPYFYEFYYKNGWHGLPLVADTRLLFFNKTTFDALGLKYPPPYGNWTKPYRHSWTWEVFSDYAKILRNQLGPEKAFEMYGCYDEEFKVMMTIAQTWGVQLLYDNNTCGLRNPKFLDALNDTVLRWLKTEKSMNPYFAVPENQRYLLEEWIAAGPSAHFPAFESACIPTVGNFLTGMAIGPNLFNEATKPNSTIAMAYPPGSKSFLGGSALMISSGSKIKDLAWEIVMFLVDSSLPWLHNINQDFGNCPPYESALEMEQWREEKWEITRGTLKFAVPSQYPLSSFPQYSALETIHPIRQLWMDIAYRDFTLEESVERACKLIDDIFLPPCESDPDSPSICVLFPFSSPISIAFLFLLSLQMVIGVSLLLIFAYYRFEPPLRFLSWIFYYIIIIGAMVANTFAFMSLGPQSDGICHFRTWTLVIGFCLVTGSIFSITLRMKYAADSVKSKTDEMPSPSDKQFYIGLAVVVFVNVVLLFAWTFTPRSGTVIYYRELCDYGEAPYLRCDRGNDTVPQILFFYNAFIIIWGFVNCWRMKNIAINDIYCDNCVMLCTVALLAQSFCALVVIPMVFVMDDVYHANILSISGVMLASTSSMLVLCLPTLYQICWPTLATHVSSSSSPRISHNFSL